jgi:hypothetical protein
MFNIKTKSREKIVSFIFWGVIWGLSFIFTSYVVNSAYPSLKLSSLYSCLYSFVLLEFILLQGSFYWFLKWKYLKDRNTSAIPAKYLYTFKILKRVNIFLLFITPFLFIYDLFIQDFPLPLCGLAIGMLIYFFLLCN